jgi:mRNA interferase RelE/StbE
MWRLEFSKRADKQLSKMDPGIRRVILAWLLKNVDGCEDPRAHGKGPTANRSGKWRYRVGDYRILCEIRDEELVVLAIEIGHRREVYQSR